MRQRCAVVAAKATRSLSARSRRFAVGIVGAGLIGAGGGLLCAFFLGSLNWAATTRNAHDWLIFLLPIGGFAVGLLYHRFGQPVAGGTSLVLDAVHVPDGEVPTRLAPMIYTGSVASHVVGASVGREGAIVQIVASLTDDLARRLRLAHTSRQVLLVCAVAAAFGGLFGVPMAGGVFALEAQRATRRHLGMLPFAVASSVVANAVARGVGVDHERPFRVHDLSFAWPYLWRYLAAAVVFGVLAVVYIRTEHHTKDLFARFVKWPPLRPVIGGFVVLGLVAAADSRAYLGISSDLITVALTGAVGLAAVAFLWKLIFTAVSLGSGFVGGEMFPLFIMGSLAGAQFARVTHASIPLFAALGLIAVFAAASNTPVTCVIIGIELFGWAGLPAYAIVCVVATLCSGRHTIYKPSPLLVRHRAANETA